MKERYARQILFHGIGREGQEKLSRKSVAIIGCGALGCTAANILARSGIKHLKIIDRDYIEETNLQRQCLFDETDIQNNLPKAIAAQQKLHKVNSHLQIEPYVEDLNPQNISSLLQDVHTVIDGTDNFETRFLINDFCLKYTIPWIYGACVGSVGLTMNIIPPDTPCLRCVLKCIPQTGTTETCDTEGIIAPIATMIASYQVAEALKILTENFHVINKELVTVDLWCNRVKKLRVAGLKNTTDCVACKQHQYEFLTNVKTSMTTSLCGRNAVQIIHSQESKLNLKQLASRLEQVGSVSYNSFLLRLKVNKYEITIFPDARAIISGTNDPALAKGIYAKYLGM